MPLLDITNNQSCPMIYNERLQALAQCVKQNCSWWNPTENCCHVVCISKSLHLAVYQANLDRGTL